MLTWLLLLTLPVSAVALIYTRWDYRKDGKLSITGASLLCLMLVVPNLVLEYATRYEFPGNTLDYVGVLVGLAGLALCLAGMVNFKSVPRVFGRDTDRLVVRGIYRWSRNPQYLGWWLFVLGFSLMDWSLWCLAALLVVAVSLHLLVLIEEEHLLRTFGGGYSAYCQKVRRYL